MNENWGKKNEWELNETKYGMRTEWKKVNEKWVHAINWIKNEEEIREIRINKKLMRIEWKKNEWEMSEEILKARSERKNEWEISERWTNEGIITEWKKAWMRHK